MCRFGSCSLEIPSRQFSQHVLFRSVGIDRGDSHFHIQRFVALRKFIMEFQVVRRVETQEERILSQIPVDILV